MAAINVQVIKVKKGEKSPLGEDDLVAIKKDTSGQIYCLVGSNVAETLLSNQQTAFASIRELAACLRDTSDYLLKEVNKHYDS